jgi:hypothetical protein
MKIKSLPLYILCLLSPAYGNAQIQVSMHLGGGDVSQKVENITTLSSGGQYVIPGNRKLSPSIFKYFETDITYFLKNNYAVNLGLNAFELFYSDEFFREGTQGRSMQRFGGGYGTQNSISYSLTLSKIIPLFQKFSMSPEIGLGIINYKNSISFGYGTQTIENQNVKFVFNQKNYSQHIRNGMYLPFNLKIQYPISNNLSINVKGGYQLHFNDYHTKNIVEYTSSEAPDEKGRAEYKYNNFLFLSIGATLQVFDENNKFQLFNKKNSDGDEQPINKRPRRTKV